MKTINTSQVDITCVLGHHWNGTMTLRERGMERAYGKRRASMTYEYIYSPPLCPVCNQKPGRAIPKLES